MKYRHTLTGAEIESALVISGKHWEVVEEAKPKKKPQPTKATKKEVSADE